MIRGLQRIIGAVSVRAPMPSLSNIQLRLDGKKLELTATDLEITITSNIDLDEAEGTGGVLVQAKRFQELIREIPDVPLEIEVHDSNKVALRGEGIGSYNLPGSDTVEFPEIPVIDPKMSFSIDSEIFKKMISKTIFAVSRDDMRPVLTGLFLQIRPGELTIVATDGHRLSRIINRSLDYQGDPIEIIVPMKALSLLVRNLDGTDMPVISLAETRASFQTGDQLLLTRLIDGNYPRYQSVIPDSFSGKLIAKTDDFLAAAKRVAICSSQLSHQVKLEITPNELKIEAEDQDTGGKGQEIISVDYNGEPLEIAYNAVYLLDVLKQIDTEEVIFEMGSSDDAAIVRPSSQEDNEDFLMLLMPIRLK
ncbi:DNA polymerase III subunit beta [bacterium]|nr:DNA polymerase III subunit beta [bacterium]